MGHKPDTERSSLDFLVSQGAGFYTYDVRSGLTQGCGRLARYFGVPVEACRHGLPIEAFLTAIHPDDRGRVEASILQAIASGQPFEERYRTLVTAGDGLVVLASGFCFRDAAGQPASFVGAVEPEGRSVPDARTEMIKHALALSRSAMDLQKPFAAYLIAMAVKEMGIVLSPTLIH